MNVKNNNMIYADFNGSSPLIPSVKEYLHKRLESELFSNPNAIHSLGQKITKGMTKSREIIADIVNCYPDQIIFNSGSSEGISQILHTVLGNVSTGKNIIISSPIEHSIIPNALSYFENKKGFSTKTVGINEDGKVDVEDLIKLLTQYHNQVALVIVMAANNETGVLQPYSHIAEICKEFNVEYFSDTTQLIGKAEFDFEKSGLQYAVCSGHKIGSLSGTGFTIARTPSVLTPLVFGSSQERGLRGGTQHYLGIETLAVALNAFNQNKHLLENLKKEKLKFEQDLKNSFQEVVILGEKADRLSGTSLIGYPGLHGQAIQIELESCNIFVTTSSACTDNQPETSKVLKAMGIKDELGRGVIRISLNYSQGPEEYNSIAESLKSAYNKFNKIKI
jgi:cysteine desulfurase